MVEDRRVIPGFLGDDDVMGHGKAAATEAPEYDDSEGHRSNISDRRVKVDVQPVEHEPGHDHADDVEGHATCARCSDENIKVDVHPVEHDDRSR